MRSQQPGEVATTRDNRNKQRQLQQPGNVSTTRQSWAVVSPVRLPSTFSLQKRTCFLSARKRFAQTPQLSFVKLVRFREKYISFRSVPEGLDLDAPCPSATTARFAACRVTVTLEPAGEKSSPTFSRGGFPPTNTYMPLVSACGKKRAVVTRCSYMCAAVCGRDVQRTRERNERYSGGETIGAVLGPQSPTTYPFSVATQVQTHLHI